LKRKTNKKRILSMEGIDQVKLLGIGDRNLRILEEYFKEKIVVRGNDIIVADSSRHSEELAKVMGRLIEIAGEGHTVTEGDILTIIKHGAGGDDRIEELEETVVFYSTSHRKRIVPRSPRQKEYIESITKNDVVFAIGPAGTGKTFLAIASALAALKRREIERIFVSRPVVEAGENLGFLPGDLQEKIDPYLRPIFDALREMVGMDRAQRMIDAGTLEIAPLAYMRGRTLNNSFAILDEAQNSTVMQMKMFLTRLGTNSKAIVTGDITQIDLVDPSKSGLVAVIDILSGLEGIKFVRFGEEDVVRHRLVRRIISAFSRKGTSSQTAATNEESTEASKPLDDNPIEDAHSTEDKDG